MEHRDLVAVGCGQVQVVERGDHGPSEPGDQPHQLQLERDVEVVGGFVENQHRALLCERPGQQHPLLLTAGELADLPFGQRVRPDPVQ